LKLYGKTSANSIAEFIAPLLHLRSVGGGQSFSKDVDKKCEY